MSEEFAQYTSVMDGLGDKPAPPDPYAEEVGDAWGLHVSNKNELSLSAFDKVLEKDPKHLDAMYGKGLALKGLGRRDEAIETFQAVLTGLDAIREDMPGRTTMIERMVKKQIEWLNAS